MNIEYGKTRVHLLQGYYHTSSYNPAKGTSVECAGIITERRPYNAFRVLVEWDNGNINNYAIEELVEVKAPTSAPDFKSIW